MKKNQRNGLVLFAIFFVIIVASYLINFEPGITIGDNFLDFAKVMIKVLPCAFILIGLFEVWVPRETVQKGFGHSSGFKGYIFAILLASTTVGGAYVAFPVAYSLYKKGAKYGTILTYVGAAALVRIPMTLFEASFLGIKFTLIRLFVSLPLVVISSIFLGRYLEKKEIVIQEQV
ncbi:MAG: permease [Halanaerobiales bacterium]|nr:permease [Halanaerobiales bacterium]